MRSFYFAYEIGFNPLKPMYIGQQRWWAFCESKKERRARPSLSQSVSISPVISNLDASLRDYGEL
jgi:hypothetical protein